VFSILGYTSEISVAPGEALTCHVSAENDQRYQARVVRIVNGDCNPLGPGFQVVHVPTSIDGWYDGRRQRTDAGSFMVVRNLTGMASTFTFVANIWPTLPGWRLPQVIAHYATPEGAVTLEIDAGALVLTIGGSGGSQSVALPAEVLLEREWVRVVAMVDAVGRMLTLEAVPLRAFPLLRPPVRRSESLAVSFAPDEGGDFYLAGRPLPDGTVGHHFNGKIEAPTLLADPAPSEAATSRPLPARLRSQVAAAWDFSHDMAGTTAIDVGPRRQHGSLINLPARAMTGSNWSGQTHDWRHAPLEYGAIHFHHDDLYDAAWDAAFTLTLPADMPSGAYAVHVHAGDNTEDATNEDYIPFFVRPPRQHGAKRAKLLFLAPTNAYLAYANDSQVLVDRGAEIGMGRLLVLQHADVYLHRHPELCASLYDKHADGSGVCYSSRLRPVLNMRPRYHSWLGSHGSALYQYNADTHILAWLEHEGIAFDVATDEDLHRDGLTLLDGYAAVMTGTHPEYHSTAMYDAMQAYLDRGGRLMYMGGNGWYWRVAFHADLPGVIEVRRAESGTRTWESAPGESYHSFNHELGGLWRRIGRAPNQIAGVGFVAQGFDLSSYYRRRPDSENPRAAFIFAGVADEVIGDFGLVGGGAAGVELDAYNTLLGSPPHALVLATSENHTPLTFLTPEEFLVTPAMIGGDESDKVRADMVFFETSNGGAVFSTGSIAWAGSLSWNAYDNNVRRITGNVLLRFLDPTPFAAPGAGA
jgi:N,N-dimethylformamidase